VRRLLVVLVVLAGLLVGLDRLAAWGVSQQLAQRAQRSQGLAQTPTVVIHGFPFLTQVARGRYGHVDVVARGVSREGVRVDTVSVAAYGVQVNTLDALRGRLREVPVQRADGSAFLTFADLSALVRSRTEGVVSLSGDAGRLRVSASVGALGVSTGVTAEVAASVRNGRLRLTPLPGALDALPVGGERARSLLTLDLPLPALPFGINLRSADVVSGGVRLRGDVTGLVLPIGTGGAGMAGPLPGFGAE